MRLVVEQSAGLHGDVRAVRVSPRAPHRNPRVAIIGKVMIEREVLPKVSRDLRVIEEHGHGLGSVGAVSCEVHRGVSGIEFSQIRFGVEMRLTLEESVSWDI